MKARWILFMGLPFCTATPTAAAGPEITALSGGDIVWTNPAGPLTMYTVEWTHDLASNAWRADWERQTGILTSQTVNTVEVPMAYRVTRGFGPAAFRGIWMLLGHDNTYLRSDGAGIVTDIGGFFRTHPPGWYTVSTGGVVRMYLYDEASLIEAAGSLLDTNTWRYVFEGTTNLARRIADPGRLAGTWRGTIGPYTNVVMNVDARGYALSVSNIVPYTAGCLFADDAGHVGGFFYTAAAPEDPWNRFQVRGTMLSTTNLIGDYSLDASGNLWYTAGVLLHRP